PIRSLEHGAGRVTAQSEYEYWLSQRSQEERRALSRFHEGDSEDEGFDWTDTSTRDSFRPREKEGRSGPSPTSEDRLRGYDDEGVRQVDEEAMRELSEWLSSDQPRAQEPPKRYPTLGEEDVKSNWNGEPRGDGYVVLSPGENSEWRR